MTVTLPRGPTAGPPVAASHVVDDALSAARTLRPPDISDISPFFATACGIIAKDPFLM
jgi:hypothetical protein